MWRLYVYQSRSIRLDASRSASKLFLPDQGNSILSLHLLSLPFLVDPITLSHESVSSVWTPGIPIPILDSLQPYVRFPGTPTLRKVDGRSSTDAFFAQKGRRVCFFVRNFRSFTSILDNGADWIQRRIRRKGQVCQTQRRIVGRDDVCS